jgi:hypothetical protein
MPSKFDLYLHDLRVDVRRIRASFGTFRSGKRGRQAVSKLLNLDELPMAIREIRFKGARKNRRTEIAFEGGTKEYLQEVQAVENFALLGVNRELNIWLRPFPSVEEAEYAFGIFTESIEKQFKHVKTKRVVESDISFKQFPDARVVETQCHYMGGEFKILSLGRIIGKDIVTFGTTCPDSDEWPLQVFAEVVQRQSDKLESRTVQRGRIGSNSSDGANMSPSDSRQIERAKRLYWLVSRPIRIALFVGVFVVLIVRWFGSDGLKIESSAPPYSDRTPPCQIVQLRVTFKSTAFSSNGSDVMYITNIGATCTLHQSGLTIGFQNGTNLLFTDSSPSFYMSTQKPVTLLEGYTLYADLHLSSPTAPASDSCKVVASDNIQVTGLPPYPSIFDLALSTKDLCSEGQNFGFSSY